EDGIRDWSVTGVQTCALPIFAVEGRLALGRRLKFLMAVRQQFFGGLALVFGQLGDHFRFVLVAQRPQLLVPLRCTLDALGLEFRSEERRVGKGGRSWRAACW